MRQWMGLVTVGLVVALGSPSFGQFGGMGPGMGGMGGYQQNFGNAGARTNQEQAVSVAMDTTDGKTTTGELKLSAAVVGCSLGVYEIKPDKIQAIRFDPLTDRHTTIIDGSGTQRPGAIVTVTGEEIEGTILIPNWWRIQTELGVLTPNSVKIKSITFTHAEKTPDPPAGSTRFVPSTESLQSRPSRSVGP